MGRWVSEDPLGFAAGDGNLFAYSSNSPIGTRDPSGQIVVPILAAAFVGGLMGGLAGWVTGGGWDGIVTGAVGGIVGSVTMILAAPFAPAFIAGAASGAAGSVSTEMMESYFDPNETFEGSNIAIGAAIGAFVGEFADRTENEVILAFSGPVIGTAAGLGDEIREIANDILLRLQMRKKLRNGA